MFEALYGFHFRLALIFIGNVNHHEEQGCDKRYGIAGKEIGRDPPSLPTLEKTLSRFFAATFFLAIGLIVEFYGNT